MLLDQKTIPSTALFSARALMCGDCVMETFLRTLKGDPRTAFACLIRGSMGQSTLEKELANRAAFDASALLYDEHALSEIKEARSQGLKIALIPDLPAPWCEAIARHLDVEIAREKPPGDFKDRTSSGVQSGRSALSTIKQILVAIRVHQWPKNALVFLPLLLSHRYFEPALIGASVLAFFALGFAASTIYVLNDLMDVGSDRKHPSKRRRPFASGAIAARWGLAIMVATATVTALIATLLPPVFTLALATYLGLNLLYTTYLKRKLLVDVLALSGSYTLRILAGNAATGIELSFWLLAFSIFLFFSLALVKRYVEMDTIGVSQPLEKRVMGRGYRYVDLEMLSQMGVSSAFAAIMVLALYVERVGTTGLYKRPELIWLICPIVLYVVSRIWFLAKRGEMRDDPVAFILRDWRSHLMGLIVLAIMVAATW